MMHEDKKLRTSYSTRSRLLAWLTALMMLVGQGNWTALAEETADAPETPAVTVAETETKAEAPAEAAPAPAAQVEEESALQPETPAETTPAETAPAAEEAPAETEAPAQAEAPAETEAPAAEEIPAAEEAPAEEGAPAAEETPAEETAPAADETAAAEPADRVVWRGYGRIVAAEDGEGLETPLYQDSKSRTAKGTLRSGATVAASRKADEERFYVQFWADDEPWFGYIEPAALAQLGSEEETAFVAESEALIVVDGRGRSFYDMTPYFTRNAELYPKAEQPETEPAAEAEETPAAVEETTVAIEETPVTVEETEETEEETPAAELPVETEETPVGEDV